MSKQMWNDRFSSDDYVYGTEPNRFLKDIIDTLKPGKIFFPAEGEGRNAVYCAKIGFQSDCFDQSDVARKKALALAEMNNVNIHYTLSDILDYNYPKDYYDYTGIFYLHIPQSLRTSFFKKIDNCLKPGGKVIIEVFSKIIYPDTHFGPPDIELRYELDEIKNYFQEYRFHILDQVDVVLQEGESHLGQANVIRVVAEKLVL